MKKHRKQIELQLRETAAALGIKIEKDQISSLDSTDTLSTFMEGASINVTQFTANFEFQIKEILTHYPGLTAYGDMVNVLCERKNFWAAMKLEKLWCGMVEKYQRINIHCGYFIKNFSTRNDSIELAEICQQHTNFETQSDLIVPQQTNVFNKVLTIEKQMKDNMELRSLMFELQLFLKETEILKKENYILDQKNLDMNKRLASIIKQINNTDLLNYIEIPIVYLDNQLRIQRYNTQIKEIVDLIPQDIGRKIFDFNLQLNTVNLWQKMQEVVDKIKPKILTATHNNKKNYAICILPITYFQSSPSGIGIFFINS